MELVPVLLWNMKMKKTDLSVSLHDLRILEKALNCLPFNMVDKKYHIERIKLEERINESLIMMEEESESDDYERKE